MRSRAGTRRRGDGYSNPGWLLPSAAKITGSARRAARRDTPALRLIVGGYTGGLVYNVSERLGSTSRVSNFVLGAAKFITVPRNANANTGKLFMRGDAP